jgi:cytosine/adenosine deaminase-related metal-dependent hydrolase
MDLSEYGLAVGKTADLVLLDAPTPAEAVTSRPVRRLVLKAGRVTARDGVAVPAAP